MNPLSQATRRAFMQQGAALAFTHAAAPLAASLTLLNNAAADTATDYKALVCVFLYGANDHYGTVVPYTTNTHQAYWQIRAPKDSKSIGDYLGIALPREKLLSLTAQNSSVVQDHALHPAMAGMQGLFKANRAAIVLNVGPLIHPTTYTTFKNKSVPLPPNLLSHNNQQAYWQTAFRGEGAPTGWAGRMADLFLSQNNNASLTCVSLNGDALILSGHQTISTKMSTTGVSTLNALNTNTYGSNAAALELLKTMSMSSNDHMMRTQYAQVMQRSLDTYSLVAGSVGTPAITDASLVYMPSAHAHLPNTKYNSSSTRIESTPLAAQLEMVARMIQQGPNLGLKRQVFMVGVGGFDLHDNLPTQHPLLLKMVSDACAEFDTAMVKMGVGDKVTTFTASDFGRTLASNGDGSDHGWGSHHFLVGGAVNGGRFHGTAPAIALTHEQSIGGGILIPTTSLEQMFAPVARWFGVSDSNLSTVFPNVGHFDITSLGGLLKQTTKQT